MKLEKHFRVCNLCEAMCGLEIEHDGSKVHSVKGDALDPFSKGSICPKGALIHKIHDDPNRLKQPIKKDKNGNWQTISWSDALDYTAERIIDVQQKHGKNAMAMYLGNPTVHNFGMMMFVGELRRMIGTKNNFSPTTMDQLPHHFIGYYMFGHPLNIPIPDVDRTKHFIMIGANPLASNGSIMSGCGPIERIRSIQESGGKVILIDPRKNETAKYVDEHIYIRPGTDVYLLLAMLHLIQKNDWVDLKHLPSHIQGLEKLSDIAEKFSPEHVQEITGVSASLIRSCLLYTSPSPRDATLPRMPSSA